MDPRAPGSTDRRLLLGIFLMAVGIYTLTGGGRFFSVDEVGPHQLTRRWVTGQPIAPSSVTWARPGGPAFNLHGPLLSLAALPGYALGRLLQQVLPPDVQRALAGPVLENDAGVRWGGDMTIFGAALTNAWISATLLTLYLWILLRLEVPLRRALACVAMLGASTLVFAHSKNLFSHSLVALLLLTAIAGLMGQRRWNLVGGGLIAGVAAGAMVLTRVQSAVMLPALCWYAWRTTPSRRFLAFGAPAAAGLGAYFLWNLARFGSFTEFGYPHFAQFTFNLPVGLYGHFFSVGRSVFIYSPPLVLLGWGLGPFRRRLGPELGLMGGVAAPLVLLYASWSSWHGDWCYGNRFLLPLVPVALLALPMAHERLGRRPWGGALWAAVGGLGFLVQVLGLLPNIAFVHHGYRFGDPPDPLPYLFTPELSQLARYADAISRGYALDPWLLRAFIHSPSLGCVAMLPSVLAVALGAWLLRQGARKKPSNPTGHQGVAHAPN